MSPSPLWCLNVDTPVVAYAPVAFAVNESITSEHAAKQNPVPCQESSNAREYHHGTDQHWKSRGS